MFLKSKQTQSPYGQMSKKYPATRGYTAVHSLDSTLRMYFSTTTMEAGGGGTVGCFHVKRKEGISPCKAGFNRFACYTPIQRLTHGRDTYHTRTRHVSRYPDAEAPARWATPTATLQQHNLVVHLYRKRSRSRWKDDSMTTTK